MVDEGGRRQMTASHLQVSDVDTQVDELLVRLIAPPQFGYIESVLPSPGFEKSNTGISIGPFGTILPTAETGSRCPSPLYFSLLQSPSRTRTSSPAT